MTTIAANPACAACRYDLAGLPGDGVCPECGLSITESSDALRHEASLLERVSRRQLHELQIGAWLTLIGVVGLFFAMPIVAEALSIARTRWGVGMPRAVLAVGTFCALVLGSWLITAGIDRTTDTAVLRTRRYLIRATSALSALTALCAIKIEGDWANTFLVLDRLMTPLTAMMPMFPAMLGGLLVVHALWLVSTGEPTTSRASGLPWAAPTLAIVLLVPASTIIAPFAAMLLLYCTLIIAACTLATLCLKVATERRPGASNAPRQGPT